MEGGTASPPSVREVVDNLQTVGEDADPPSYGSPATKRSGNATTPFHTATLR